MYCMCDITFMIMINIISYRKDMSIPKSAYTFTNRYTDNASPNSKYIFFLSIFSAFSSFTRECLKIVRINKIMNKPIIRETDALTEWS